MPTKHLGLAPAPYAGRAIIAIILFAAANLGFPFVLWGLVRASHCAIDTCGAVGLAGAAVLKPVIVLVFLGFLLSICVRRVRNTGLPALCGLFVPLMAVVDLNFMLFFGTGWAYAFSSGVLEASFPMFFIYSLACVCLLCVAPSGSLRLDCRGWLPRAVVAFGSIVIAFAFLRIAVSFAPYALLSLPRSLSFAMGQASHLAIVPMIALVASLSALAFSRRGDPISTEEEMSQPASIQDCRRNRTLKNALAAAAVLAVALTLVRTSQGRLDPWALLFLPVLLPIILPTALLYFPVVWALFNLLARKNARAVGLVPIALLPFAPWVLSFEHARSVRHAEAARIAAIPVVPLDAMPSTIVAKAGLPYLDCDRLHAAVQSITTFVLITSSRGHDELRARSCGDSRHMVRDDRTVLPALPETYVLIAGDGDVSFDRPKGMVFEIDGKPVELRFVTPTRNDRLAVTYREDIREPAFPPLLATEGWFPSLTGITTDELGTQLTDFTIAALKTASAGRPKP